MHPAPSRRVRHAVWSAAVLSALACFASPAQAKNGDYVYLRTAPVSLGIGSLSMAPVPGGGAPMHFYEVAGLGFSVGQWEIALNIVGQNLLPRPDEYSVFAVRAAGYWRFFKEGRLRFVEPFALAGFGGGSSGLIKQANPACTSECVFENDGWGGGLFVGGGIDVNFPVLEMGNGQRIIVFTGLEIRQELYFHRGPNLFTVFAVPIGVRLD